MPFNRLEVSLRQPAGFEKSHPKAVVELTDSHKINSGSKRPVVIPRQGTVRPQPFFVASVRVTITRNGV